MEPLKTTISRIGDRANNRIRPFSEQSQEYVFYLNGLPKDRSIPGHLSFGFSTNADALKRSRFYGSIEDKQFGQLAAAMMRANPEAAIRAFGAAMQNFGVTAEAEEAS